MIWSVGGVLLVLALLLWMRSRVVHVNVVGPSMLPAFGDGDRLVAKRVRASGIRTGDVVVVDSPRPAPQHLRSKLPTRTPIVASEVVVVPAAAAGPYWVIKRVAALPGEPVPALMPGSGVVPPGSVVVLGDNLEDSIDSRHYGYLSLDDVLAKVMRRRN